MGGDAFASAFAEMAVSESYPLVFNCFLGKDRTGVLAALVLGCLGVERGEIVDDYALTATRVPYIVEKLRSDQTYRDTIDRTDPVMLGANAVTMTDFLEGLEQRFGGARGWALNAGVSESQLNRISDLLLE